jgi:hypothetical protein
MLLFELAVKLGMVTFLRPCWLNLLHNRKLRHFDRLPKIRLCVMRNNVLLKNEEFLKPTKLERGKDSNYQ